MDRLNKQQACQLYIEQEIEKGLADGKTAYKIAEEVTDMVAKVFRARVSPEAIRSKVRRIDRSNDHTPLSPTDSEGSQRRGDGTFAPGNKGSRPESMKLRDELEEKFPRMGVITTVVNAAITEFQQGMISKEALRSFADDLWNKTKNTEKLFDAWKAALNTAIFEKKK